VLLVTGKAGFIGKYIDGIGLDDLSRGRGYVKYLEDIRRITPWHLKDIDCVVHLAAWKDVEEAEKIPLEYWGRNFEGTKHLLEVMLKAGVNNLVFASSAAVYGDGVYGRTKKACEWLIESLPFNYAILRLFNVTGPDATGLPKAVRSGKVTIFGNDYHTRDGTCERDYVHVLDVANAIDKAVAFVRSGGSVVCDIGSGSGMTVLEVCQATGVDYEFAPRRRGDLASSVARKWIDCDFNWKPAINPWASGIGS